MKLSAKALSLLKKAKAEGLDEGIMRTYLFAKSNGYETDYFPADYQFDITKSSIERDRIPENWLKEWVALWPTPGQVKAETGIKMEYSISGNLPQCRQRLTTFIKEWPERIGEEMELSAMLEQITEATVRYLEHLRDTGYKYPKKNLKFILDTNGSILESWIKNPEQKTRKFYL